MTHVCIKCGTDLVVGENITKYRISVSDYTCRQCTARYHRNWRHLTGRNLPGDENRECAAFLGVHVAERVLSHVFKDVERTPYGTTGFDFVCRHGHKIDVKSCCRIHNGNYTDRWLFNIRKNLIADYFLCLAFDNRESLNPEYIWLIPGSEINNRVSTGISKTTLEKWGNYELPIDKVVACCDIIRGRD
jgi:hypothetical protein